MTLSSGLDLHSTGNLDVKATAKQNTFSLCVLDVLDGYNLLSALQDDTCFHRSLSRSHENLDIVIGIYGNKKGKNV